jgi:transcriptional regulator with XRE-family HTH domain
VDCQSRLAHTASVTNKASLICLKIAEKVKFHRRKLGISQEILAEKANIDRTYASQIERAIANPSLTVLCSIANALEINLSDLLSNE